jgi:hypothetical protein
MNRRTARSSDTDLNSRRSSSLLSPSYSLELRYCNPGQFVVIAIKEESVMAVHAISNRLNAVQLVHIDMMLASVIRRQHIRFNDCSPVQ